MNEKNELSRAYAYLSALSAIAGAIIFVFGIVAEDFILAILGAAAAGFSFWFYRAWAGFVEMLDVASSEIRTLSTKVIGGKSQRESLIAKIDHLEGEIAELKKMVTEIAEKSG